VASRVIRLLVQRGVLDENSCALDRLVEDEPVLAELVQASVLGTVATGQRAGQRIRRVLADPSPGQRTGDLCFASRGFSLHAARRVSADQRGKLEELLRYVLRPPLANNRLRWLSEDELLFALKRKWDDGTTHILFSPTELIARLAAIVPPKGFNGVRYHGVLGPRARLRPLIVPRPAPSDRAPSVAVDENTPEPTSPAALRKRILWADLLRRVFRHDVDHCCWRGERVETCARPARGMPDIPLGVIAGGRFKLVAFITDQSEARRYYFSKGCRAAPRSSGTGPGEFSQPAMSTKACRRWSRRSLRRARRRRKSSRSPKTEPVVETDHRVGRATACLVTEIHRQSPPNLDVCDDGIVAIGEKQPNGRFAG
jgi:hypothetical protein